MSKPGSTLNHRPFAALSDKELDEFIVFLESQADSLPRWRWRRRKRTRAAQVEAAIELHRREVSREMLKEMVYGETRVGVRGQRITEIHVDEWT